MARVDTRLINEVIAAWHSESARVGDHSVERLVRHLGAPDVIAALEERGRNDPVALALLGHLCDRRNETRRALESLESAHELDPNEPAFIERLIEVAARRDDHARVLSAYQELAAIYERRHDLHRALAALKRHQRHAAKRSLYARARAALLRFPVRKIKEALPARAQRLVERPGVADVMSYTYVMASRRDACEAPRSTLLTEHACALSELSGRARSARGVIIYLPTFNWSRLVQRPHQMMRELAAMGFLCFFCPPRPDMDGVDGFKEVEPNLLLCSDVRLLFDFQRPIVWVNWPLNHLYIEYFTSPFVVYEAIDELDVFYLACRRMETDFEELVRMADLVIASADRLLDRLRDARPDTILVPNGCRPADFEKAETTPVPDDLAPVLARGRPIVGYYGALAKWFDYGLFNRTAEAAPDLSFVVIGQDHDGSAARIVPRDNVFVLGEKAYSELGSYSSRFSVATIPFVVNDITRSTSPVKLFEYMAVGVPIVTTALDECRKYGSVIVAESEAEYLSCLRRAIALRHDAAARARLHADASDNTWERRARLVTPRLSELR